MKNDRAKESTKREDSTTGSFPAGQTGARITLPVHVNSEGINRAIDPEGPQGCIYSGMTRRIARWSGRHTNVKGDFTKTEPSG
jgi:hypothetical protein